MMHSKHNKLSHYFKIIILIVEVVFILFRFAFIHKQFWRFLQVWKLLWHYNIHFSKRYVVNLTSWPLSSCSFTASKKVFLLFGFSFSVLFNSKMFLILFFLRIFFSFLFVFLSSLLGVIPFSLHFFGTALHPPLLLGTTSHFESTQKSGQNIAPIQGCRDSTQNRSWQQEERPILKQRSRRRQKQTVSLSSLFFTLIHWERLSHHSSLDTTAHIG